MVPSFGGRKRAVALALGLSLLSSSVASTTTAFAEDAKASLAEGDKAAKSKDWAKAAGAYEAANKAAPSSEALDGLANAHYQGGQLGDAFTEYSEWIEKYGGANAAKKKNAENRIKDIAGRTGAVQLNVSEPGAAISVDDKPAGTSPLAGPLRLTPGAHKIKVTKDTFLPFEAPANVSLGGVVVLDAKLIASSAKGRIAVKEKTGKPLRILIDDVDVGEAPYTGDVDPGQHSISARGTGLVAAPQKVTVESGKTVDVELTASSSSAPVKIGTSDGKGLIFLDGKLVGEGTFVAEIPSGIHKLKITREGYDPFEEDIAVVDKQALSRTVTLKLVSKIETGPMQAFERLEGIYGGFNLLGMFTPGGTQSQMQIDCENRASIPELRSCDAGSGFGGGLGGFVGYHWDPVGMELFLAGSFDQRTITNEYGAANTDPGIGPDPARNEEWNIRRAGFVAMGRIRVTWQTPKLRVSLAAGVGVSRRIFFADRDTRDPVNPDIRDVYVSESSGYWSPIVGIEPGIYWRAGSSVAIGGGFQAFLDAPATFMSGNREGENPRTSAEGNHRLAGRGLSTPSLDVASNTQIYLGPFIGMMFGP